MEAEAKEREGRRAPRAWIRPTLLVLLLAMIVGSFATGAIAHLHPESIQTFLREAGAFGPVLFIVLFALGEMLAIPSVLFILAAGLAWPFPLALGIAWLGSIVSAGVVFLVSRYLVRDFVQARLSHRLRDLDARLERGGVLAVATLRLLAFLAPWTHPALAISSVTLRDYTLGTALGVLPGVTLLVLFGDAVARGFERIPGWVWGVVLALIVLQVVRVTTLERSTDAD